MAYRQDVNADCLKRMFAIYVVVATKGSSKKVYVGKTGDNRKGCNPIISRIGNHFSYNNIHSQIRNKIEDHESYAYTYYFDHFFEYDENDNSQNIATINELERWCNQQVRDQIKGTSVVLLNEYKGKDVQNQEARIPPERGLKLAGIVREVCNHLGILYDESMLKLSRTELKTHLG